MIRADATPSDLPLTSRQAEILAFIEWYYVENGVAPTLREIGEALGIASTNGVNDHMIALMRKGALMRTAVTGRSRQMVPTRIKQYLEAMPIDWRPT